LLSAHTIRWSADAAARVATHGACRTNRLATLDLLRWKAELLGAALARCNTCTTTRVAAFLSDGADLGAANSIVVNNGRERLDGGRIAGLLGTHHVGFGAYAARRITADEALGADGFPANLCRDGNAACCSRNNDTLGFVAAADRSTLVDSGVSGVDVDRVGKSAKSQNAKEHQSSGGEKW